jgi:cell wall-associated NlpC family hydrolase
MIIGSTKRRLLALVTTGALAALAATSSSVASPDEIRAAQAEAERVLAEIAEIDQNLELAVEAYNSATIRLDEIQADIEQNERHLDIARKSFRLAQRHLAERLVALYTEGEQTTLEVILGSASLDELVDRLDSAERISEEDVRIVTDIRESRAEMRVRERKLARARAEQKQVVTERGERREWIEGQLSERQALYSSIEDQIAELEAEERERQRRLEEERRRQQEEAERIAAAAESVGVSIPEVVSAPEGIGTAPPGVWGGVVGIAMQYLGVPYVWGGASPSGFDCSGLVVYAFAQAGLPGLPHYTGSLWQMGVAVSRDQLAPGDLVFFNGLGHMGIYIGGGQMIHAPHTGDVVKISDISSGYYLSSYVGARRLT